MRAGSLDRFVQFRRATLVDDGFGMVETWANYGAPTFASRADVSDGERWRAGEVVASITTRFVVRHDPLTSTITPKDRLICEGLEFNIVGVKEPPGTRRQWIELTCAARIDQ